MLGFLLAAVVAGLVTWNLAGAWAGEALAPRPTPTPTERPTSRPTPSASLPGGGAAAATGSPAGNGSPATPMPTVTPTPPPQRRPVDVRIEARPVAAFVTEYRDTWCAAAAVQVALNVNGPDGRIDTSRALQARIRAIQVEATSRQDSRNGGAGPLGMVASLEQLGAVEYELRDYPSRAAALRAAARAISDTGHAAILLAWRGAHAWVMTGYRADADPTVFRDARVTGAYVLDPWYPRVSSIWGRSDKPGTFQDAAEMKRNFLPWRRPEGRYPDRDGRFLVILPSS